MSLDADADGEWVTAWTDSKVGCRKCDTCSVRTRIWAAPCHGDENMFIECRACGDAWWLDAPGD